MLARRAGLQPRLGRLHPRLERMQSRLKTVQSSRRNCAAVVLLAIAAGSTGVAAHRLDECLQAARIAVEPDRLALELDVTPGVAIAESFIPEIDRDRDGTIAAHEQQEFIRRILGSVDLSLDGHRIELSDGTATFPELAALRTGEGMIRLRTDVAVPRPSAGVHEISFRNRYRGDVSVYLANALVPDSDRVAITAQHHSAEQRELMIDYELHAETATLPWPWIAAAAALALTLSFLRPMPRPSIRAYTAGTP